MEPVAAGSRVHTAALSVPIPGIRVTYPYACVVRPVCTRIACPYTGVSSPRARHPTCGADAGETGALGVS